tara:strand:- start:2092 stop:2955 length:864 start_codon:yes stop_codon:yes gene_type:complete
MPSKTQTSGKVLNLKPSTFETIDKAVLKWIDETLNIHSSTNDGWKKIPVVWITAERAFQIKNKREMRSVDSESLIFPLMTIERESVTKTPVAKRPIPGHLYPDKRGARGYRGGAFTLTSVINQNKTRNYAATDSNKTLGQYYFPNKRNKNKKIVRKIISIPFPVYYDMTYNVNLRTDYQQQMNEMMVPFATYTGGINQFRVEQDNHFYEIFIEDSYSTENNISSLAEEEKKYETVVKLKVLGYLIGSEKNQDTPKISIRENLVDLKFRRERVIVGDINEVGSEDFRG